MNSEYEKWVVVEQLLLGWLDNSMTQEMGTQVVDFQTSKDLWQAVQNLLGVHSREEEDYLCQIFQETKKGNLKMIEYLITTKFCADSLTLADGPMSFCTLVCQVSVILDKGYNPITVSKEGKYP